MYNFNPPFLCIQEKNIACTKNYNTKYVKWRPAEDFLYTTMLNKKFLIKCNLKTNQKTLQDVIS